MPTPPLPLFQNLLDQLDIPIRPNSLSSIPPSLLLLTLEKILQIRLPLSTPIRQCKTPSEELLLVKCLVGVMADDELGMDLSAVDPVRVVMGTKEEMGVIIMGLVVIAKRHGIEVHPKSDYGDLSMDSRRSEDILDEDEDLGSDSLDDPLQPDVTLSSPIMPDQRLHDVFGVTRDHRHNRTIFHERENHHRRHPSESHGQNDNIHDGYIHDTPLLRNDKIHSPIPLVSTVQMNRDADEKRRILLRDVMAFDKVSTWQGSSQTTTSSTGNSSGHRTVLQEMMDEFGLG